mmetsp:Transcript_24903/g.43968  ORF Transcript_24903/g.43968 Transcript_24903/m.43968 type:complete len:102 (-) Transcript_24903:274-579(-)
MKDKSPYTGKTTFAGLPVPLPAEGGPQYYDKTAEEWATQVKSNISPVEIKRRYAVSLVCLMGSGVITIGMWWISISRYWRLVTFFPNFVFMIFLNSGRCKV